MPQRRTVIGAAGVRQRRTLNPGVRPARADDGGFFQIFGQRVDRVPVGEVADALGLRLRFHGPRRPLGDQNRRPLTSVVMTQKAGIDCELFHELGQHMFTDFGGVGRGRLHQLHRNRCHDEFQAAWHGVLRYRCGRRRGPSILLMYNADELTLVYDLPDNYLNSSSLRRITGRYRPRNEKYILGRRGERNMFDRRYRRAHGYESFARL